MNAEKTVIPSPEEHDVGLTPMPRGHSLSHTCIWLLASAAALQAELPKSLQPFMEKNCLECHDSQESKGGLNLEKIPADLSHPEAMAKWVRIFDRTATGEMPPKKKKTQPAPAERTAFIKSLGAGLTDGDSVNKATVLRRLNRTELEQTLNDLLGINEELASLLPEDGRAQGFDKVGEALDLSSVHLQRTMDAARQALAAAMNKGERPATTDQSYALDSGRNASHLGKSWHKLADGAVVVFNDGGYPGIEPDFSVKTAGLYRVTFSGKAYQSDQAVIARLYVGDFGNRSGTRLVDFYEFKPGGTEFTLEIFLKARERLRLFTNLKQDYNSIQKLTPGGYKGAGLALKATRVEGPILTEWPGAGHRLLFGDLKSALTKDGVNKARTMKPAPQSLYEVVSPAPTADGRRLITAFTARVFRGKPTPDQAGPYLKLFEDELKGGSSFEDALLTAYTAILCAPGNLYFQEKPGQLDNHALAARLSYMLWGTAPDVELRHLASSGSLSQPKVLRTQTDRLINDPRSQRFVRNFTDQWLSLRDIDNTTPDRQLYPEYDEALKYSMVEETRRFFAEILTKNLSVTNFLDSDWTILNGRMAEHYNIAGVEGTEFRKVMLKPEDHRGGVITHASILKVSANGTNTSPVVRGAWILDRILGTPPNPPPPGTPGVEPDTRGATTLRQTLEKHRTLESCNSCHAKIDPPGFALESYDPAGNWQTNYRSLGKQFKSPPGLRVQWRVGPPVDATGVTADGQTFTGLAEFKQKVLLAHPEAFTLALTRKLAVYGSGRAMGFSDRPELDRIVRETTAHGNGLRELVHNLVQSQIFLNK